MTPIRSALRRHPERTAKDHRIFPAAARTPAWLALLIALAFFLAAHAHAQGCAQCLDNTRATPPAVQAAYRHAIFLLGGTAAALFLAGTWLIRRHR